MSRRKCLKVPPPHCVAISPGLKVFLLHGPRHLEARSAGLRDPPLRPRYPAHPLPFRAHRYNLMHAAHLYAIGTGKQRLSTFLRSITFAFGGIRFLRPTHFCNYVTGKGPGATAHIEILYDYSSVQTPQHWIPLWHLRRTFNKDSIVEATVLLAIIIHLVFIALIVSPKTIFYL